MYLPFDSMPAHSRLWIYQANRPFSAAESDQLQAGLKSLCEQWSAHGAPLHTSFNIRLDQFVVLVVDEQQAGASGCSIDGSVRYLKSLQEVLSLDFFDRITIAFLIQGKIITYPLAELKTLFESQTLSAGTISFDNTVTSKADWEAHWQTPVKDSWMARYLPKTAVAR